MKGATLMKRSALTNDEIIRIYENSHMGSENFTVEAVTAAYVAGLAALIEIDALRAERDALRARCDAAEYDLSVERGCLSCWYMEDDCPADCDRHGRRWKWRGVDRLGADQCAPGDAPLAGV
jgi:hypothetical protein